METPLLYVNLNERRDEKLGNELPASSFGDKPIGSVLDFTRISMLKAFRKMEFWPLLPQPSRKVEIKYLPVVR